MRKIVLFIVLLTALLMAESGIAASTAGIVTIATGNSRLLRGPSVFKLQEGVVVSAGDVLEVGEGAQLQVEYADGTTVGLGPQSSVLITDLPSGASKPGGFFLLAGWLKASGPAPAGGVRTSTPILALQPKSAIYVVHSAAAVTEIFVESGELVPVAARKAAAPQETRKSGEFFSIKPGAELEMLKRPTSQFLATMPRIFINTLPVRYEKFAVKPVEPVWESEISFSDADRWLRAYPLDHKQWLTRISTRLKDKDFRAMVEKSRAASPEWEAAIHAEKAFAKSNKP